MLLGNILWGVRGQTSPTTWRDLTLRTVLWAVSVLGPRGLSTSVQSLPMACGPEDAASDLPGPTAEPGSGEPNQKGPSVVRRHPETRARRALKVIWTVPRPASHLIDEETEGRTCPSSQSSEMEAEQQPGVLTPRPWPLPRPRGGSVCFSHRGGGSGVSRLPQPGGRA